MNQPRSLLLLPWLLLAAHPALADPEAPAKAPRALHARAEPGARKEATHGTVNLNQADGPTLELLPGVGEKKAERIITFRHAHPFHKVEDLTKVRGFGKKTLARLKPYLTVSGPSTLGEEPPAPK